MPRDIPHRPGAWLRSARHRKRDCRSSETARSESRCRNRCPQRHGRDAAGIRCAAKRSSPVDTRGDSGCSPRRERRSAAGHRQTSWELPEEADVVLEEDLNVVDAVLEHGEAIDAHAEGEATHFFRIVLNEAVDGGIDHARAEKLDPAGTLAFRAGATARGRAAAAAENAGDVEFDRRLGERKVARAKARLYAGAEELLQEIFDGTGEVAKRNVGVDGESLDLVKDEG